MMGNVLFIFAASALFMGGLIYGESQAPSEDRDCFAHGGPVCEKVCAVHPVWWGFGEQTSCAWQVP